MKDEKCEGKKYCDCAKEAFDNKANLDVVDGLERDCPYNVAAPTGATDNSGALPKPSEMAIPDMEKLRSMMEDMPEQKRIEFINEHTEAAAKILYIAFHAAKLDHGISSKMVCKDERFILRFDKENSPLTEENIKVRYQSEKPIFPEIIVESKLKETRKS